MITISNTNIPKKIAIGCFDLVGWTGVALGCVLTAFVLGALLVPESARLLEGYVAYLLLEPNKL